jgi:hypothetical protein
MNGNWSYQTWSLQDGHGTTCTTSGTQLQLTQQGVNFNGSALFGAISCTWTGGSGSGSLGSGHVSGGTISGDSVSFSFDAGSWRSVGAFATPDSMAGIANLIYVINGSQLILTGYWSAVRE